MLLRMFSLYDIRTEVFLPPTFCHNEMDARRLYMRVFTDMNTQFSKFPEDYNVMEIGVFNDAIGLVKPLGQPKLVVNGLALVQEDRRLHSHRTASENEDVVR